MRKTEEIAKLVIEAALPGTEMKPNLSQSHGEYDFHLHYLGGNVAAVEVTESAIQLQKQISAEIQNNQGKKLIIEAKKCKKSWWIIPMENADLSSIRGKVDTYLSSLEQAGREKFDFLEARTIRACRNAGTEKFLFDPAPQCVEDICYDLNIMSGSTFSDGEAPRIFVAHPTSSGAFGPDVAIKAAEREAHKQDNKEKLGKATTQERHLVVYVDKTRGLPWFALIDLKPPPKLPKLPREITDIWAGWAQWRNGQERICCLARRHAETVASCRPTSK